MTRIRALVLLALFLAPEAALAQGRSGSTPAAENRSEQGAAASAGRGASENRPEGAGNSGNRGNSGNAGNSGGAGNSGNSGNAGETGRASGARASPSDSGGGPPAAAPGPSEAARENPSNHDFAMEAVRSGRAVQLDRVLEQAIATTGGQLVDTRLVSVDDVLLYELKMLDPDGSVQLLYYYARTGNPVTMN